MAILRNSPKSAVFSRTYIRRERRNETPTLNILRNRDMHENELMRYSEAIGNATESAAQDNLSPTLMVACLTRYIDVVVRCADDNRFRPIWSTHKERANFNEDRVSAA